MNYVQNFLQNRYFEVSAKCQEVFRRQLYKLVLNIIKIAKVTLQIGHFTNSPQVHNMFSIKDVNVSQKYFIGLYNSRICYMCMIQKLLGKNDISGYLGLTLHRYGLFGSNCTFTIYGGIFVNKCTYLNRIFNRVNDDSYLHYTLCRTTNTLLSLFLD